MPNLRTITLSLATAAAVACGLLLTAGEGEAGRPQRDTEQRTLAFLEAVEREDLTAVARFQHPDITLTHPLAMSGGQQPDVVFNGREEALGYVRGLFAGMSRIRFVNLRIAVTNGGKVSFAEADGDFVTADGRPYRNVYVIRIEWSRDGRALRVDEYYNPIIACRTFQEPSCAPTAR